MNIAIASWPDTAPTFGNQHPNQLESCGSFWLCCSVYTGLFIGTQQLGGIDFHGVGFQSASWVLVRIACSSASNWFISSVSCCKSALMLPSNSCHS